MYMWFWIDISATHVSILMQEQLDCKGHLEITPNVIINQHFFCLGFNHDAKLPYKK